MSNRQGSRLEDVVLNQIQTQPNRRVLLVMEPFRVPGHLPDTMVDLLRRMEMAEHNAQGNENRRSAR